MNDYKDKSWIYDYQSAVESSKCKVGDIVHYHDDEFGDDFDCTITFIGDDGYTVRIYCDKVGCLVYEQDFDEYCKVVGRKED